MSETRTETQQTETFEEIAQDYRGRTVDGGRLLATLLERRRRVRRELDQYPDQPAGQRMIRSRAGLSGEDQGLTAAMLEIVREVQRCERNGGT